MVNVKRWEDSDNWVEVDFMKAKKKGIIKADAPLKDLIKMGKIV